MKTSLFFVLVPVASIAASELATDYTRERSLRTETKVVVELETTLFEMQRDGEPMERPGGSSDTGSEETRQVVQVDQYLANAEGKPSHVKRKFEEITGESVRSGSDPRTLEGVLSGATLELKVGEDGELEVTVADGDVDDDALLEGHRPEHALDALLPDEAVEEGASWELSGEAIARALGLDLVNVIYKVAEEEPEGGGGEGRGGGRGGFGRRFGGSGGYTTLQYVEWKGEAKLVALDEEHEGVKCAVIELEIEGEGEVPLPDFGGGRDRERSFALTAAENAAPQENTVEAKFSGRFFFANESRRPRALELTGEMKTHMSFERDFQDSTMSTTIEREGKCDLEIQVTEEE